MKNESRVGLIATLLIAGFLVIGPTPRTFAQEEPPGFFGASDFRGDSPIGEKAASSEAETPELGRVATVFAPGSGSQGAASVGFETVPQGINWEIVVLNASCNCFWDQCVYSRWSSCYQYLCIDPGC